MTTHVQAALCRDGGREDRYATEQQLECRTST